jgi:aminoglycoside phosphotransferase (APT) family kinase protein
MEREASLLRQISPVFQLAPRPYTFCNDLSILGAPFYVMQRRKGIIINNAFPTGITANAALCRQLSNTVVETLVQIHSIDWRAADLSSFGHPAGFLARQVKGWIERYARAQTEEVAQVEPLTRWLVEHVPASPAPTVIHNDFKLNNVLLDASDITRAVAVLDWEMATIGDPLFDLAVSLSYWAGADDPEELRTALPTVTMLPGFIRREEFMRIYAHKSGRDLSEMHFYIILAYFKMAVIIQQIYVRWWRGQTQDERFAAYGARVHPMIIYAAQLAEKGHL